MKRASAGLVVALLAGCEDASPATGVDARALSIDASRDALGDLAADVASPPWELSASGAGFDLSLRGSPAAVRLRRGDQTLLDAAIPWLVVGVRDGGVNATRISDARLATPPGITWIVPTQVRAGPTPDSVTLTHPATGDVVLRLVRTNDDALSVVVDAMGPDVAMLRFDLPMDAGGYHGLGEQFAGADARGRVVPMQLEVGGGPSGTNEAHVPVPFVVSTRGYGFFAETTEAGAFDVGASDPMRCTARFEGTHATVHFFARATPRDVVAAYTRLTGLPRLPPSWAFGHQQWRNEWDSDAQVLEDARRLRSEGIPTSVMWIDNPWQVSYSDSTIDRTRFRDPEGMMAALRAMGFRVIFWSVPFLDAVTDGESPMNPAERLWVQARDANLLVRTATGRPYVSITRYGTTDGRPANGSPMDWTNPAATPFWTEQLHGLIDLGARGFKLDYAEDIVADVAGLRPGFRFFNGDTERRGRWFYPQGYHAAYRAALDRYAAGDGFVMGRASSWGGQRVVDVIWPGDLDTDFSSHDDAHVGGLRAAIHGMMSLSESGFPSFASDTGGYRGGMPGREVLLRWAEQTAMSPFMQLGGGGTAHNPWEYDPDAVTIYRGLARLHDDLAPYYIARATEASTLGTPPVLSLAMAFPDDPGATDPEEYLIGYDLLMAPVVVAGATTRAVHVPPGTWVHWWSGRRYTGPADVMVPAPLGQPPLFARGGAVVAMNPSEVQTLVPTAGDQVVDVTDRAAVARATAFPTGASANQTLPGGGRLGVLRGAGMTQVDWAPAGSATQLRLSVVLGPEVSTVSGVTLGGASLVRDAGAREGTCARCWDVDAARGTVWLVLDGAGTAYIAGAGA